MVYQDPWFRTIGQQNRTLTGCINFNNSKIEKNREPVLLKAKTTDRRQRYRCHPSKGEPGLNSNLVFGQNITSSDLPKLMIKRCGNSDEKKASLSPEEPQISPGR